MQITANGSQARAEWNGNPHLDRAIVLGRVLDSHDGVRALGNHGARHDAQRGLRLHGARWGGAGSDFTQHSQPHRLIRRRLRDIARPDGIAVHRRVGKGRNVPLGANLFGQYATAGLGQGNGFSIERSNPIEDLVTRLGDRQ